ncbi:aminotransferase class I/II-fold pyridoxal phosphate-dependent enzyme [Streptomyces roseirectus]|uniref:histidinol-phosphate transaminase n=1 Tax=Streptomyces roseirectus TaxID=2768066 RepID=A0A7H0IE66_9ACTN|nr:aminotransferase class I/II-fold pyridoxal phosphate-dependent enzyme [Streptomyces roseirectus]QNP71082.1 aminotransferase class I/II-fold pyridoxal phosphate-dependent enzyme [Streptomyces roseirectus]
MTRRETGAGRAGTPVSVTTTGAVPGPMAAAPASMAAVPGPMAPVPAQVTTVPGAGGAVPASMAAAPGPMTSVLAQATTVPGAGGAVPVPITSAPGPMAPTLAPMTPTPGPMAPVLAQVTTVPGAGGAVPVPITSAPGPMAPVLAQVTTVPGAGGAVPVPITSAPVPITSAPGPITSAPGPMAPTLAPMTPVPGPMASALVQVTTVPGAGGAVPASMASAPDQMAAAPDTVTASPHPAIPAQGAVPAAASAPPGTAPPARGAVMPAPDVVPSVSGSVMPAPGSVTSVSGTAPAVSGSVMPAPGSVMPVSGSVMPVSGTAPAAPGTASAAPGTAPAAPGTASAAPGTAPPVSGTASAAPGSVTLALGAGPAPLGALPAGRGLLVPAPDAGGPSSGAALGSVGSPLVPRFPLRASALAVAHPPRRRFAGVNLKSCELQHPLADRLVAEALRAVGVVDTRSYPVLAEVRGKLGARYGVGVEGVLVTAGSDSAIGMLVDAFAVPAGRLIVPEPAFEAWEYYARLRGVPVTSVRQLRGQPPRLDNAELFDAVRAHPPSVVALTSPAGLSGLPVPAEEVGFLADVCERYGHLLVVDECYGAYAGVTHTPLLVDHPRLVVVRSHSKSHALAGARIAAVFAGEDIAGHLAAYRPDSTVSGPALALLSELLERTAEFAEVWDDVRAIRDEFADAVEEVRPGWRRLPPGGNFVTFHTGSRDEPARAERALLDAGFRTRALTGVPGLGECLRISLADRPVMRRVVDVLAEGARAEGGRS